MSTKICAIITTYFPDANTLAKLLNPLKGQVESIVIVNNGGDIMATLNELKIDWPKIKHLTKNENLGTAGGYNLGAEWAFAEGHTHMMLFDQDSQPAHNMVAKLLEVETGLRAEGKQVAAVGPYYTDVITEETAPFIVHRGLQYLGLYKEDTTDSIISCSYLISSGSLISKEAWSAVGPKDEGMFLDYTDIEWGLRANDKGWGTYGCFEATMYHQIGEERVEFFGKKINLHSPVRHYYAFRNCIELAFRSYIPWEIKLNYLLKLIPKFFLYSFYAGQPRNQMRFMLIGVRDGFRRRLGRF